MTLIIIVAGLLHCVSWTLPGDFADSSTQDVTTVSGILYEPCGAPAKHASVVMRSSDYLPQTGQLNKRGTLGGFFVFSTYTNDTGYYKFTKQDSIPPGRLFIVEAHDSSGNYCLIGNTVIDSILYFSTVDSMPCNVFKDTLKPSATVKGKVQPFGDFVRVIVAVYGLDQWTEAAFDGNFILSSLPEGRLRMVFITKQNGVTYDTVQVNVRSGNWTTIDTSVSSLLHAEKRHSLTLTADGNGTVDGPDSIVHGATDSIFARPDSGCHFAFWHVTKGKAFIADSTDAFTAVALNAGDAVMEAVFKRNNFPQTFGKSNNDYGQSIQQTIDGGFVIIGYNNVAGQSTYLVKTDVNGNEMWSKSYKMAGNNAGYDILQTIEGGYIITGQYDSAFGNNRADAYLLKTDPDGNEMWRKTFGGTGEDLGNSVQQTGDGGFIIAGYTDSYDLYEHGTSAVFLIKTDANGNEMWFRIFGEANQSSGYSVRQTIDNGYIIVGQTVPPSGSPDYTGIYLIKTDPDGNKVWSKTFCGSKGYSVVQTFDKGYILTGYADSDSGSNLIKTDGNGNEMWRKKLGETGQNIFHSVIQTPDSGYIIAGSMNPFWNMCYASLIKTDANGNEMWKKMFGETGFNQGNCVRQTGDGGYIMAGFTESFGAVSFDILLIKTDKNGNIQ
jgi:hypothetical protein